MWKYDPAPEEYAARANARVGAPSSGEPREVEAPRVVVGTGAAVAGFCALVALALHH